MTGDRVEVLRAALDQAEKIAKAVESPSWYEHSAWLHDMMHPLPSQQRAQPTWEPITRAEAAHIAAWDPSRVLRLVALHRELLDEHAPIRNRTGVTSDGSPVIETLCQMCVYTGEDEDRGGNRFRYREHAEYPCPTVELITGFWLGEEPGT